MVEPPTSPAALGAHPPMPPATSAASPLAVFPSPIRGGVSRGDASAPRVDYATDHGMTYSVYFFDPDGSCPEIFCEMMAPENGWKHMREGVNLSDRNYQPEPILLA
jgi:hypothetical protein